MKQEIVSQAGRAAPALVGTVLFGLTLNEWVGICTIGYILLQAAYLLRKWWREEKRRGRYVKETRPGDLE